MTGCVNWRAVEQAAANMRETIARTHQSEKIDPRTSHLKISSMITFSDRGPRSIDERDVIAVYRGGNDGRYSYCTLVLRGGSEISGAVPNEALARLERELDDNAMPPAAVTDRACST
jgi:hypothetical protein